uniref:Uncharacterized protein n=1 Tax=Arundo donax TaxID=35708 RepID=A0A0A9F024_ARUDO
MNQPDFLGGLFSCLSSSHSLLIIVISLTNIYAVGIAILLPRLSLVTLQFGLRSCS